MTQILTTTLDTYTKPFVGGMRLEIIMKKLSPMTLPYTKRMSVYAKFIEGRTCGIKRISWLFKRYLYNRMGNQ